MKKKNVFRYILLFLLSFVFVVSSVIILEQNNDSGTEETPRYFVTNGSAAVYTDGDVLNELNKQKSAYGFKNIREELVFDKTVDTATGTVFKYTQHYKGIEVFGRGLNADVGHDNSITAISGNYLKNIRLSVKPSLSAEDAEKYIHTAYSGASISSLRLSVYSLGDKAPVLTYFAETDYDGGKNVFVDANTGKTVAEIATTDQVAVKTTQTDYFGNQVEATVERQTATSGTYTLADASRKIYVYTLNNGQYAFTNPLSGPLARAEAYTSTNGVFADRASVSAFVNAVKSYDYYKQANIGTNYAINSTYYVYVHYGDVNYNNAHCSWAYSGSTRAAHLAFGDGKPYAAAPDVVGHEFQHSLTGYISGLVYEDMSGALNEAYSDIFGSLIEGYELSDYRFWEHGYATGSPNRNMSNPSVFGDPDHTGIKYPSLAAGGGDYGGVHYNSNIITYAQYLMYKAQPSLFTKQRMGTLWWKALSLLTKNATFSDFRTILVDSARQLGYETALITAIENAFDEVGVAKQTIPWSGAGTSANPYKISSSADLYQLAINISSGNAFAGKYFEVTADINLNTAPFNTGKGWRGTNESFNGIINGNGKTIRNLYMKDNTAYTYTVYHGLFGIVGAGGQIKNLNIDAADIAIYRYGGILAGIIEAGALISDCSVKGSLTGINSGGISYYNSGTIQNSFSTATLNSANAVGGIAYRNIGGTIKNCYNTGTITTTGTIIGVNYAYAGGIAAENSDGGVIDNCNNRGNIDGKYYIGGIVGNVRDGQIVNCYNTGKITSERYVGGIAGIVRDGTISNCYNTGDITGDGHAGGIAGYLATATPVTQCYNTGAITGTTTTADVGGIAGSAYCTITYSYNTGKIEGKSDTGGIAGSLSSNMSITQCYNTGAVTATTSSAYSGGITGSTFSAISYSYNTGKITCEYRAGGITGSLGSGMSITQCFNTGVITASTTTAYAGGISGTVQGTISFSYNTAKIDSAGYGGGIAGWLVTGTVTNCYSIGDIAARSASYGGAVIGWASTSTLCEKLFYNKDNCANKGVANGDNTNVTALSTAEMFAAGNMNELLSGSIWHKRAADSTNCYYYEISALSDKAISKESVAVARTSNYNPEITAASLTYGAKLSDSALTVGTAVAGTAAWVAPTETPAVTNVGYQVAFTPANEYYLSKTVTVAIAVYKATPVVATPSVANFDYVPDKALGSVTLDARWTWDTPSAILTAGNKTYGVTYTPADTSNFNTVSRSISFSVNKATPSPAAPTIVPANYENGLKLGDLALPSNWAWNAPNTLLFVGDYTFTATYTPADTANYNTVMSGLAVKVLKTVPPYTLPVIDALTYAPNRILGDITLPSGWLWDTPSANITAGTKTYNATFAPEDTENYGTVTRAISFTVNKAAPVYTVPTPAAVTYSPGLTLANIPLTQGWSWNSPATPLTAGSKTYAAIFTPADTQNYNTVESTVSLAVNKATPVYTVPAPSVVTYSPELTLADIPLTQGWSWSAPAAALTAGSKAYAAVFTPADTQNYNTVESFITFTVNKATPIYTVPVPSAVTYFSGLALANITLPQGWSWSAPATLLTAGSQTCAVIFTPADAQNYNIVEDFVNLTVNKANPVFSAPAPDAVTYSPELTLAEIPLTTGWSWSAPATPLTAGNKTYIAVFTPADTQNYNTMSSLISFTVNKAVISNPPAAPILGEVFYRNGLTLSGIQLPDGWTWEKPSAVPDIGTASYNAQYTPDRENYIPYTCVVSLTLNKGTPAAPVVALQTNITEGTSLSDIVLPEGWVWQNPSDKLSEGTNTAVAVYQGTKYFNSTTAVITFEVKFKALPVDGNMLLLILGAAIGALAVAAIVIFIVRRKKSPNTSAGNYVVIYNGREVTEKQLNAIQKREAAARKKTEKQAAQAALKQQSAQRNKASISTLPQQYQPPVQYYNVPAVYQTPPPPPPPSNKISIPQGNYYYDPRTGKYIFKKR